MICVCVFEDSKLSFHKHGVAFLPKNLKSINPTSKNQELDCFSVQDATSGGMKISDKSDFLVFRHLSRHQGTYASIHSLVLLNLANLIGIFQL